MKILATALVLLLLAPGLAAAADPWGGLSDEDVQRLAADLQKGRDAEALAEAQAALIRELMAQVEGLEATVEALKAAEAGRALAVALAEDRDKRRAENEAALVQIVAQYRGLLDDSAKVNERAMRRIESLESQQKWMMIGGVIGLAAMFIFLGF